MKELIMFVNGLIIGFCKKGRNLIKNKKSLSHMSSQLINSKVKYRQMLLKKIKRLIKGWQLI